MQCRGARCSSDDDTVLLVTNILLFMFIYFSVNFLIVASKLCFFWASLGFVCFTSEHVPKGLLSIYCFPCVFRFLLCVKVAPRHCYSVALLPLFCFDMMSVFCAAGLNRLLRFVTRNKKKAGQFLPFFKLVQTYFLRNKKCLKAFSFCMEAIFSSDWSIIFHPRLQLRNVDILMQYFFLGLN